MCNILPWVDKCNQHREKPPLHVDFHHAECIFLELNVNLLLCLSCACDMYMFFEPCFIYVIVLFFSEFVSSLLGVNTQPAVQPRSVTLMASQLFFLFVFVFSVCLFACLFVLFFSDNVLLHMFHLIKARIWLFLSDVTSLHGRVVQGLFERWKSNNSLCVNGVIWAIFGFFLFVFLKDNISFQLIGGFLGSDGWEWQVYCHYMQCNDVLKAFSE